MKLGSVSSFNREVTVQKRVATIDGASGGEIVTWEPLSLLPGSPEVAERFAAEVIDGAPGHEESVVRGDLALARNMTRVRMRWRDDIDSSMRIIVHGDHDRTLQIVGGPAEIGGRKVALEFLCVDLSS